MIVTSLAGDRIESELGAAELVRLKPRGCRVFAAVPGEQAVVVLDGVARLAGTEVRDGLGPGTVVVIGAGESGAVQASDAAVTLFWLRAVVSAPADSDPRTQTRIVVPSDCEERAIHDPDRGFFRMTARLMVNGASGGHRAFTVGMSTFAPGTGAHALHRHAHAEELFLVWAGEGVHLSGDRPEHRLRAGELTWVARNEPHGFGNTGPGLARAVFCYLGVDDRAGAGYEVLAPNIRP